MAIHIRLSESMTIQLKLQESSAKIIHMFSITKVVELEADSTSRGDGHTDHRGTTADSSHLSQFFDGNMQIFQQKASLTMVQINHFEVF